MLQFINGLEVSIKVGADVIPRISRIVDVLVRPEVGEYDLPRIGLDIGKGVEDVARSGFS